MVFLIKLKLYMLSLISVSWASKTAFHIFITPYRKPRPFKPAIFEKAEEFDIQVDGNNIHGYRWQKESNKKVLLVHGFESRAFNFNRYVQPLLENGYGVYAMDAKAHGLSEGKTITIPEYMSMFHALNKMHGPFEGYITHSFGGISVCLYEEKNNHPNTKIVLIAPATETATALRLFCKFFNLSHKINTGMHDFIFLKSGFKSSHFSLKRIIPELKNPILWIHDEDDDITPLSDVEEIITSKQPNIEFMITKNLGHRKIYNDNRVIEKTIRFL